MVVAFDEGGSYGEYFVTTPAIGQSSHWTLVVDTNTYGTDFLAFFATDHHRLVGNPVS